MQFFGSLGIDWRLFLAQIVNFAILLWLLKKLVYKPIIKRIEKDEAELEAAKREREALEKEREEFAKWRQKETEIVKEQSQEIIKEAQSIAKNIEKEAKEKIEKKKQALLLQFQSQLKNKEASIRNQQALLLKEVYLSSLSLMLEKLLSESLQKEFQKFFFKKLKTDIKRFGFNNNSLNGEKKISVILETSTSLSQREKSELKNLLSQKLKKEIKIVEKRNKNLISGFRLEIKGFLFEENLLSQIKKALDNAQYQIRQQQK